MEAILRSIVCALLRSFHDVAAAGRFEDFLRALGPLAIVAVHRDEIRAFADPPGIAFRFDLGDAGADQSSDETTGRARGASAGERRDDRSGRDERADSGNGDRADADQPTQYAADRRTGACA